MELALNQINLSWGVNNVTVLEFDFIPNSDTITFRYVFGSQEYFAFENTQYNLHFLLHLQATLIPNQVSCRFWGGVQIAPELDQMFF